MSLEPQIPDVGSYIVIPHTHNLRWIMMFYALPREMFQKLPDYRQMPRNLRPVAQSDKYRDMIMSDQFLETIWNLYAWVVWHCLRVPGRNGEYRPIPGVWQHYSENFPIWQITYEIAMHFREVMENGSNWTLQSLFDLKKDEEMPWLGMEEFLLSVKVMTQFVIDGMNLQPFIDEVWIGSTGTQGYSHHTRRTESGNPPRQCHHPQFAEDHCCTWRMAAEHQGDPVAARNDLQSG